MEILMYKRLPPLNSLKSFESAARHLSFTKAADELCVTQAAVSHQIKLLEEFLGNLLRNTIYLDLQQNTSQYYKHSSFDEKWLLKKKPEFLSNEEKQYLQYLDLKDIEFIKQSYYFSSNEYDYLRKKYKDYSIEEMEIVLEEVYSIYKVFVLVVSKTTNTKFNDTQIEELEVNAIKQILTKVLPINSLY